MKLYVENRGQIMLLVIKHVVISKLNRILIFTYTYYRESYHTKPSGLRGKDVTITVNSFFEGCTVILKL